MAQLFTFNNLRIILGVDITAAIAFNNTSPSPCTDYCYNCAMHDYKITFVEFVFDLVHTLALNSLKSALQFVEIKRLRSFEIKNQLLPASKSKVGF